ncbi:MAG: hypothetical protein FJW38_24235 [Acidobacteria bacterium]|nr:hypothetical protein [Acidobacteriota bacterium]
MNWRTARRMFSSDFPTLFATALLSWANLIHTAQIASLVGILDTTLAYFLISLGVSVGYGKLFGQLCSEPAPSDGIHFRDVVAKIRADLFSLTLAGALALITCAVLLMAISVLANNWDTLAYRFPRAIFFMKEASLSHPGVGLDPRLLFYPYNASLLYLMFAEYHLSGVTWNFVSVFGWAMAGMGAFYVPLFLGGTVRAAMFSAYALLTTPIVLCLAYSTNDEVLAGGPMLLGVIFLASWFRDRSPASLVLAMIGIGLSAGVKLHVMFYFPMIIVALIWAVRRHGETIAELVREHLLPHRKFATAGLLLAMPLAFGFLVTNYISSKQFTSREFNNVVMNTPFHVGSAAQNTVIRTAQLFIAPLPDHALLFGRASAISAIKKTNDAFNNTVFKNVKQGPPYSSAFYRFRGVASPYAEAYYEETVWLGLAPWGILVGLFWMVLNRSGQGTAMWLLVLSLPAWHLALCAFHVYVECIGTYYGYAAPLGIAAIGLLWERMALSGSRFGKIGSSILTGILVSNTLLAGVLFFGSQKRDITHAFRTADGEVGPSETSAGVRNAVAKAKQVYIPYTHWELLFWNFMRLNPSAKFYHSQVPRFCRDNPQYPMVETFNYRHQHNLSNWLAQTLMDRSIWIIA